MQECAPHLLRVATATRCRPSPGIYILHRWGGGCTLHGGAVGDWEVQVGEGLRQPPLCAFCISPPLPLFVGIIWHSGAFVREGRHMTRLFQSPSNKFLNLRRSRGGTTYDEHERTHFWHGALHTRGALARLAVRLLAYALLFHAVTRCAAHFHTRCCVRAYVPFYHHRCLCRLLPIATSPPLTYHSRWDGSSRPPGCRAYGHTWPARGISDANRSRATLRRAYGWRRAGR